MDSKPTSGVGTATVASAREEAADFIYEIKIVLKSVLYKHVAPFRGGVLDDYYETNQI